MACPRRSTGVRPRTNHPVDRSDNALPISPGSRATTGFIFGRACRRREHRCTTAGRRPTRLRAYAKDLADFAAFLKLDSAARGRRVPYRRHLRPGQQAGPGLQGPPDRGNLAPATIARRLAALRSVVELARTLGRVAWAIDIPSPRAEAYRDTRGPGLEGWKSLLPAARKRATTAKGKRDLALVRLMHDLGLRRGEVVALDLGDLDLEAGTVAIVGNGKSEKTNVTLNAADGGGLADWVAARGEWPGALRAARPGRRSRPPDPAGRGQRGEGLEGAGAAGRAGPGHQPPRAATPGDHPGPRPGPRGRAEGEAVQPPRQVGDAPEIRRQPAGRGRGHRQAPGRGLGVAAPDRATIARR